MPATSPKALLDEYPMLVLPSLAKAVGLEKALILQQLHFWLRTSPHMIDGVPWIYNSYPKWKEQFPWWHIGTIKRYFLALEKQGLIRSANFNPMTIDRTKWYTINYPAVWTLLPDGDPSSPTPMPPMTPPPVPDATTMSANCAHQRDAMRPPLPETTTEITSEICTATERENTVVFSSPVAADAVPETGIRLDPLALPLAPTKGEKPLDPDDWLYQLLVEYQDDFPLHWLNSERYWLNVANTFYEFNAEWVRRAFAALVTYHDGHPRKLPRKKQGWRNRMTTHLQMFYKHDIGQRRA